MHVPVTRTGHGDRDGDRGVDGLVVEFLGQLPAPTFVRVVAPDDNEAVGGPAVDERNGEAGRGAGAPVAQDRVVRNDTIGWNLVPADGHGDERRAVDDAHEDLLSTS